MLRTVTLLGDDPLWRSDVVPDNEDTGGNIILSCEFVKYREKAVLYVRQSSCSDYLYDPETDEYLYVVIVQKNEFSWFSGLLSLKEKKMLEERLKRLTE